MRSIKLSKMEFTKKDLTTMVQAEYWQIWQRL